MKQYPTPKADAWKIRDNNVLFDVRTGKCIVHNRTRGKMRLFLGEFRDGEFHITLPTIMAINASTADQVREACRRLVDELNKDKRNIMKRRLAS